MLAPNLGPKANCMETIVPKNRSLVTRVAVASEQNAQTRVLQDVADKTIDRMDRTSKASDGANLIDNNISACVNRVDRMSTQIM